MSDTQQKQFIRDMLNDELMRAVYVELGMDGANEEEKADVIAKLGDNIMARLTIEILKVIPRSEHEIFLELLGNGEARAMHEFLEKHIHNLNSFLQVEVMKEYEATKTEARRIAQGL